MMQIDRQTHRRKPVLYSVPCYHSCEADNRTTFKM